jgi:hypothetical protein
MFTGLMLKFLPWNISEEENHDIYLIWNLQTLVLQDQLKLVIAAKTFKYRIIRFNFLLELLPTKFAEHMKRQYYMISIMKVKRFYAWYFAKNTILLIKQRYHIFPKKFLLLTGIMYARSDLIFSSLDHYPADNAYAQNY